jgi:prepilin-type N-terminal cleavage/methylation domain-containing protein
MSGWQRERGFSLLELLAASAIFLILCGAAFGLLAVTQKSYQNESQQLNSFQEARLALDQIVRDVNIAGYPPRGQFANLASNTNYVAMTPFAWWPGYNAGAWGNPCTIAGNCQTPGDFELIIETNLDPLQDGNPPDVEWVRYSLQGTTLFRGVTPKAAGSNPISATDNALVPFVQNVMNNAPAAQIAQLQALYPSMFPGGTPVPVFQYVCDEAGAPVSCGSASPANNAPANIREVEVTLIVRSPQPDATTGLPRLVMLNGRGHRLNPNQ